jgi:hypothetical protein
MPGLVQVSTIEERNQQKEPREKLEIQGESEKATYGAKLNAQWNSWKEIRQPQEDQWLMNLRQFYSQYEPTIQMKAGRSRTFIGITRMKVMAGFSRLVDIFFPASGKRHWEVGPTPESDNFNEEEIEEPVISNGIADAPQIEEEETPEKLAAKKMSKKINDQLVESDYDLMLLEGILECAILGTGCLKAASIKIEKEFAWVNTEDQGWLFQPIEEQAIKPQIEGPSVFDIYPDPNAANIKSAVGCFQRHIFNKHEFRQLKKLGGFKPDEIDKFLLRFPNGNHTDLDHEIERKKLAFQTQHEEANLRYDVLEYWGWVDGLDLREVGVEIPDSNLNSEYMANVWCVGSTIIKAVLDPSSQAVLPFFLFPYEKVPKKIFGKGVPEICSDSQEILNAAARRLLDDVAMLGPQIEVNVDEIDSGAQYSVGDIFPFKVHPRSGGDNATPLIRVHNLNSVSAELVEIIGIFRNFIDEELNLPTLGTDTSAETAEATRAQQSNANIINRSIVKNIDKYAIDPFITKLYMFFMQWSDDESIKGDYKVNAKGSSTLVKAEAMTTQLINMLNITNNPTDQQLIKRDNMLRMIAENQGLDADEVVKTKKEIDALSQDPVKRELEQLGLQKATLENQEISSKIDQSQAEIEKIQAAIEGDEELVELKRIELQGKEIEAAANLRLREKEINLNFKLNKAKATETAKAKPVAGQRKTTVGTSPKKKSKNDGLKSNNKE